MAAHETAYPKAYCSSPILHTLVTCISIIARQSCTRKRSLAYTKTQGLPIQPESVKSTANGAMRFCRQRQSLSKRHYQWQDYPVFFLPTRYLLLLHHLVLVEGYQCDYP